MNKISEYEYTNINGYVREVFVYELSQGELPVLQVVSAQAEKGGVPGMLIKFRYLVCWETVGANNKKSALFCTLFDADMFASTLAQQLGVCGYR